MMVGVLLYKLCQESLDSGHLAMEWGGGGGGDAVLQ